MHLRDAVALGSGIPIRALQGDAESLDPGTFEDRHGSAFLLLTAADLTVRGGSDNTDVMLADDTPRGDSTARLKLMVFPLRPREGGPGDLITIGRSSRSDVVVPDVSVSRFHAFVKRAPNGGWVVCDAGSSNGTMVDGRNAPQQDYGDPLALKAGSSVRLGQVELTYLDLEGLRDYLARL